MTSDLVSAADAAVLATAGTTLPGAPGAGSFVARCAAVVMETVFVSPIALALGVENFVQLSLRALSIHAMRECVRFGTSVRVAGSSLALAVRAYRLCEGEGEGAGEQHADTTLRTAGQQTPWR